MLALYALTGWVVASVLLAFLLGAMHRATAARPADRWLEGQMARKLVVHTAEQSYEGLLVLEGGDGIVLRAAGYLAESGRVPLAGDTFIPRSKIEAVQQIGESAA